MWMVPAATMCNQHLLSEHRELHAIAGMVRSGYLASLKGHAAKGQVEIESLGARHEEVVDEMLRRGMNHHSPFSSSTECMILGKVDREASRQILHARCNQCKTMWHAWRSNHMKCKRCDGTGWLDPIGPCADGSYITMRPCSNCNGSGKSLYPGDYP